MPLKEAMNRLAEDLRQSNPKMQILRNPVDIRVDGESALSTYFSNDSPLEGREPNGLLTLQRPEGLLFIVFTAPRREYQSYERVFQLMLSSVRVNR